LQFERLFFDETLFRSAFNYYSANPNYNLELVKVNGQIGIIYSLQGKIHNVVAIEKILSQLTLINSDRFILQNRGLIYSRNYFAAALVGMM
jgi:hypothetical protein